MFLVERKRLGYEILDHDDDERWSGRLIRWFFDLFESIWKLRNKVQFGDEPEAQIRIRSATADRAIRRLFAQGAHLPRAGQYPFRKTIVSVLGKQISEKERWIELRTKHLVKALVRVLRRTEAQQHAITEFFSQLDAVENS